MPMKRSFPCCCRSCQRTSGGGHTSLFVASAENLATRGGLRFVDRTAESGSTVSSGFCPTCGSPVMSANSAHPDARYIHAASLDDPTLYVLAGLGSALTYMLRPYVWKMRS